LKKSGFAFYEIEGLDELFKEYQKRNHFEKDHKDVSNIEMHVKQELLEKMLAKPQQRDSWFLSSKFQGPYEGLVEKFFKLIRPLNDALMKEFKSKYTNCMESIGVHFYDKTLKGEGLTEHIDVNLFSYIYSNGPVDAKIGGKWNTVDIPKNHIMIFTGLTLMLESGATALKHRVPHCVKNKFTIGVFMGAPNEAVLKVKNPTESTKKLKTVADLNEVFFGGKFNLDEIEDSLS